MEQELEESPEKRETKSMSPSKDLHKDASVASYLLEPSPVKPEVVLQE